MISYHRNLPWNFAMIVVVSSSAPLRESDALPMQMCTNVPSKAMPMCTNVPPAGAIDGTKSAGICMNVQRSAAAARENAGAERTQAQ
jgi:hypothetical protein